VSSISLLIPHTPLYNYPILSPLHPLPPHPPATSDHCNHVRERAPFVLHLHFASLSLSYLSRLSLVAATSFLLWPLSRRRLHWCTSLSVFSAIVVPPFLQCKFLTRFCFVFHFVYINFQFRLLQVLIFIGIEIVWIVYIYYELALVSRLRFNTKIMYCPQVFILKKLLFF